MSRLPNKRDGVDVEPIRYDDGDDWRIIDLRPDGCDCIPVLASSSFRSLRNGVDLHIHPEHVEISLCLKGNIRYDTANGECQILPGQLFVSKPGEPHRRCNNPKGMRLYRLLFKMPKKGSSILGLTPRESSLISRGLLAFPYMICPSSQRVRVAFERLFRLYDQEERGTLMRRLAMKSAALELLLALIELPKLPPSPHGRPNSKVKTIIARMETTPEAEFLVEDMASEAALSTVAFIDAFKRATGLTPHAYLLDVRVKRARADLANPKLSVAAIASRYRFPSPQHFATVFKRITGISPSMCRK